MRRLLLLIVLSVGNILGCFGQLISKVDERIELTSIVFRIAGYPEYSKGNIAEYNSDVDLYFKNYRYHELIPYVIGLRNSHGLGYSAVAASALFIDIVDGKVIQNQRIPISLLPGLGKQWTETEETFVKYVELLNDFYQKTNFHKFFNDHTALYETIEKVTNTSFLENINVDWFSNFFGSEFQYPKVFIALINGPSNYFITDYEAKANYAIVIGGALQNMNFEDKLFAIIHEICHNYSDPLFYKYWPEMETAANKIYPYIEKQMRENAYGSAQESLLEWQNNLFSIQYFIDNEMLHILADYYEGMLRDRGFIGLPRSIQFMENFSANRKGYPYIGDFLPQLIEFFNYTASDFDKVVWEYSNSHPYITNVFPVNGSNIWEMDCDAIRISFSQPMSIHSFSVGVVENDYSYSKIPRSDSPLDPYWENDHTFVIPIVKDEIEPNKKYGILLSKNSFSTPKYNMLRSNYTITYYTTTK